MYQYQTFFDQTLVSQLRGLVQLYEVEMDIAFKSDFVQIALKCKDSSKQWRKSVRKYTEETLPEYNMNTFNQMLYEIGANDPMRMHVIQTRRNETVQKTHRTK